MNEEEKKEAPSFFPKPKLFKPKPQPPPVPPRPYPIPQPHQPQQPPPIPPRPQPQQPQPQPQQPQPQNRSHGDLMDRLNENTPNRSIRDIFNTSTKLYKDNKVLVDKVVGSLEKKDGSWLQHCHH